MLVTLLASCKKEDDFYSVVTKNIPSETNPPISAETDLPTVTQAPPETEASPSRSVSVEYLVYKEENEHHLASVQYPVISGTENADAVNTVLYDAMLALMQSDISYTYVSESFLTYEISDVALTYSNKTFASFLCKGSAYSEGAAHPTDFVHTLNVDLSSAKLYGSDEIITDFHKLTEYFTSDTFSPIASGSTELDAELASLSRADLINQYNAAYGIYPKVYFTQNEGVTSLAVSVETVYALGSHAEFSAPTDSITDALSDSITELTKGNK